MQLRTVGVVGCGLMGSGIAEVCARSGYDTIVREVDDKLLARGMERVRSSMDTAVQRGKLAAEERDAAQARLRGTTRLDEFAGCDLVIEAATENLKIKQETFAELDRVCPPHAILASNTSSISITKLGGVTRRPEKVIGMHFMNPVPLMKLVEVVRGLPTSDETYQITRGLAERFGKTTVVSRDIPGFIVNRVLMPMLNEACFALYEGIASAEDIDKAVHLGLNHPLGPLALIDLIGLDTTLAILEVMHRELGEPKYRPCTLLRQYVAAGWYGRKSGMGFYDYSGDEPVMNPGI
jgi:3-hydroxybutyryl-CoA dehydrogenase